MRLVISNGIQYDADNLPAHVDASTCIPADEWFAANRVTKEQPKAEPEVAETKATRRRGKG